MTERPARDASTPIHDGGRRVELDAEAPVERIEAAVIREDAREPGELDADHLVARLGRDESSDEELAPDREHVVERRVHARAGIAARIEPDPERDADGAAHVVGERHLGARREVLGEQHGTPRSSRSGGARAARSASVPSNGRPDACASRWRTVEPGGPAGSSRSTTPSSAATSSRERGDRLRDRGEPHRASAIAARRNVAVGTDDTGGGERDRPVVDLAKCLHARRY